MIDVCDDGKIADVFSVLCLHEKMSFLFVEIYICRILAHINFSLVVYYIAKE